MTFHSAVLELLLPGRRLWERHREANRRIYAISYCERSNEHHFSCSSVSGSTALCWTLAAFSFSWSFTQLVGLLGRGISPWQGRYLQTEYKHRINAHRHPCPKWDSSGRRPRGRCGLHFSSGFNWETYRRVHALGICFCWNRQQFQQLRPS
jgi:hypothetical protein